MTKDNNGAQVTAPDDAYWMGLALEEALQAAREDEVPVGAVAVLDGECIARDHNRPRQLCDPTAHAEVLVLRQAGRGLSNYRLNGVDLYVTIEPCAMCAGALIWARIHRLIYGAADEKAGAVHSRLELLKPGLFNHLVPVTSGIREIECRQIMQEFFRDKRG